MKSTDGRRICIVMMSAVGDAVHALPVVTALKRHDASCHITWILQPGPATLVRGHPDVDEIVEFDRSQGISAFGIRAELRRRPFDLVINLQVYFKAGLVTAMARSPQKLGFDRGRARDFNWLFTNRKIPARPVQHVQDQYLEFLTELAVPAEPLEWKLGPWAGEIEWRHEFRNRFDRPVASIVVGTSKPEKDWLPDRWAAVSDALFERHGMQTVLVGGESAREREAVRVILANAKHSPVSMLGSGLRRLVSILDASSLVISPDTGPLHMSVALGTPVISLLGYTNPRRTGPYKKFHDLIVDVYGERGESYGITMENRPGRMARISVADVLDRVEIWKERYAGGSPTGNLSGPNS